MDREEHQFQLYFQVAKNVKGLRVGGTRDVSHETIEATRKERISSGKFLVTYKGRHYSVVVDADKNLNITRTV